MKRSNRKRHRPEEVVAKLRQADEALAKGTPIAEVARSLVRLSATRWKSASPPLSRCVRPETFCPGADLTTSRGARETGAPVGSE